MLHIVHGDSIDHNNSVIFPREGTQKDGRHAGVSLQEDGSFITNDLQFAKGGSSSYCSRPSAGPPFNTSEMTMEVSPL